MFKLGNAKLTFLKIQEVTFFQTFFDSAKKYYKWKKVPNFESQNFSSGKRASLSYQSLNFYLSDVPTSWRILLVALSSALSFCHHRIRIWPCGTYNLLVFAFGWSCIKMSRLLALLRKHAHPNCINLKVSVFKMINYWK